MSKEKFLVRARKLVKDADKWRKSADNVLNWASLALGSPGNTLTDSALKLVDRCFKISELDSLGRKRILLMRVKDTFKTVAEFYAEVAKGTEYLNVGPPIRPDDIAYALVNGWASKDKSGLTFVLARCDTTDDVDLTDIIMHESIHYAGGIDHFEIEGVPAYGSKVFSLKHHQAMVNASSYAYFAYIARLESSQWATAT